MIRKAKKSDFKELQELSEDLGYSYDSNSLYKNLEELLSLQDHIILVKEIEENKIIGYVHGQIYRLLYYDKLLNILGLVISEKYRNLGYGKALMLEIEKWAKLNECKGIRLNSGNYRREAHKFYEAIGYTMKKEQKYYFKQL